ncbi:MAG: hypothetical protein LBC73_03615 [Oscillospiraceae bacterium]|nr:hypothetical protein [Oscillospiraceae bacterium]
MRKLFDEENDLLLLDEIVFDSPSFQALLDGHVVVDDEIILQANRVIELFKEIDKQLKPKDKELVVSTICELAVLYEINALKGGSL